MRLPPYTRSEFRVLSGADPAAGAEISEAVPAGKVWRLLAVRFALVTDATVGNRKVHLALDDGASEFFRSYAGGAGSQGLATTGAYSFGLGVGADDTDGVAAFLGPLPEVPLLGGYRVRTVTTALAAGDNFGAPVLYVEELSI